MKKLLLVPSLVLGMTSTAAYALGYSDSFDVTVNRKPLKCDGTQRVYFDGGAMGQQLEMTAVCSEENTSSSAVTTAKWVASSSEGRNGTFSSYGNNCYLFRQSGEMGVWKCKKWMKGLKVNINPHNSLEFDEAYDYMGTEQ